LLLYRSAGLRFVGMQNEDATVLDTVTATLILKKSLLKCL